MHPSHTLGPPALFVVLLLVSLVTAMGGCIEEPLPPPDRSAVSRQPVVYGEDDRMDYYAHPDEAWRQLTAESIVALIPRSAVDRSDPDDVRINAITLQEWQDLCPGQRFADQPTAASCSGTLIDDDLVMTAGHCVDESSCGDMLYVFNYYLTSADTLATITEADVYECQHVVAHALAGGDDYAILQLDRNVTGGHQPAPIWRGHTALEEGQSVTVVGFGSGLPAKIDTGGVVVDNRAGTLDYFQATTDTFGGNSGSGVFNAAGEVVGILVRGETDYVTEGGCTVVNELPDDGSGGSEDATYAFNAFDQLCDEAGWPSARVCSGSGEGWCDVCGDASDCPEGWSCDRLPDEDLGQCQLACGGDAQCREDHHCGESGVCEPDLVERCSAGDVWRFDTCNNRLELVTACGGAERCEGATCVPRLPGDVCAGATPIAAIDQTVTGNLNDGFLDDYRGSCGGGGPERVYRFDLAERARLTATATGFDTLLYLRSNCLDGATERVCNDDSSPPGDYGSLIRVTLDPGRYFLFMDAYSSEVGAYSLTLQFDDVGELPPGDLCADATPIDAVSQRLTGDLTDYNPDYTGSCAGEGPERVFVFDLEAEARLTAESTGFDTVLFVRGDCTDPTSEALCNDDIELGVVRDSHIEGTLTAGRYFLFMDAWDASVGSYQLDLDFGPVACGDGCTEGDRRCAAGGGFQLCVTDPADGCTYWSAATPCPEGQVCQLGECQGGVCADECDASGLSRCVGDDRVETCSNWDDDPCLEWGPDAFCPAAEPICVDGECQAVCEDACLEGDRRCRLVDAGSGFQVCRRGADGCTAWAEIIRCDAGDVCQGGFCVPACGDECIPDQRRCAGDDSVEVCVPSDDGCFYWSPAEACSADTICSEGACVPFCADACELGVQRCSGEATYEVCLASSDPDGCPRWSPSVACGAGQICADGRCVVVCSDACLLGERICDSEGGYRICAVGLDGCTHYSDLVACAADAICVAGFCQPLCEDACEAGASRCAEGGVQRCQLSDAGCLAWSSVEPCAPDESCRGGVCVPDCPDPCEPGERRCGDDDADGVDDSIEVCVVTDAICPSWIDAGRCPDGRSCVEGECVGGCADDECTPGERECDGDRPRVCQLDAAGCAVWTLEAACPDGQRCDVGECRAACPEDECVLGARRCADGESTQQCQLDADGCRLWADPVACPLGASCSAGVCRDDCEDDCQPAGQIECLDDLFYEICGDVDEDACLEWSAEMGCIEGEVCLPEVGCAGGCPADLLEPNNGPSEAVFLGAGDYPGLIVCAGDDDWIGFDGMALGDDERLVVVLSFEHDRGDIDLVAYAGDGVAELARSDGTLDGERLELRSGADRSDFLLRVYLPDTETNSNAAVYHLTLSVASGEGECTDGARRCLADGLSFQKCGDFDLDGRTEWGAPDACGAFAVCEGEGECLWVGPPPPEPGPDAGPIREAAEGRVEVDGCGCAAASPARGRAAGRTAWLLLGVGMVWVRRRRGR